MGYILIVYCSLTIMQSCVGIFSFFDLVIFNISILYLGLIHLYNRLIYFLISMKWFMLFIDESFISVLGVVVTLNTSKIDIGI